MTDSRSTLARTLIKAVLLAIIVTGAGIYTLYLWQMRQIHHTLENQSSVIDTAMGPVAFSAGGNGNGSSVLVVHGAGGGHDQGRLLAQAFLPAQAQWVAPSRFGYPGSPLPEEASTPAQADAFAALLDAMELPGVIVFAISGGVPPALQFALRHPERTIGLILVSSAPYAPLDAEEQALPIPIWLYNALFASNLPTWLLQQVAPGLLLTLFDASPQHHAPADSAEATFLQQMTTAILPVTARREGLANEGAAIEPTATINLSDISTPTLIIHARDDQIAPVSTAHFSEEGIPDAILHLFDSGGHFLLGRHEVVRNLVADFIERVVE